MSDQHADPMTPTYCDNVIPFRRPESTVVGAPPDRLQQALVALEAALDEQRLAVADWRAALGELQDSMQGLGSSLQTYRTNLDGLAIDVAGLNAVAVQLQNL